ncbi:MAG TPA: thermonuclease family protein [Gemmatimonadaceae bacterium]|nr:thermonuclease family protein [Gemmatimonadaceae bacterium]
MKLLLLAAFALACVDESQGSSTQQRQTRNQSGINERTTCTVTRISDGDSIVCSPLGKVRLLQIDAPELSDGSIGRAAREKLQSLIPIGTRLTAETDVRVTDKFGRVLAFLFLPGGEMVNQEMAKSGYVTTLVYPPNVKYVERIRAAVLDARKAKRGLWATGGFDCAPRDYRAGRCR